MMFRGHVRVGIVTAFVAMVPVFAWILYRQSGSIVELGQYWWEVLICFILCILGALVPDIDIKSKSQRVIYAILIFVDMILVLAAYYMIAAVIGLFGMMPNVLKHRGQTHSRIAAVILPVPLLLIPILATGNLQFQQLGVSYYIAAVFGYISHLIADRKGRKA